MNKDHILKTAQSWTQAPFDEATITRTLALITANNDEFQESFYKNLEFGTGGMRGIMGVGTNRINKYTLGKNTQGLSQYLNAQFPDEQVKVAIAYDCRRNSKELAQVVADVFSANGIHVYLFAELRPTPLLSYTVKAKNCHAGIVLTASHNPPEYNGYKVYWQDGGQLVPPQDQEILDLISLLDFKDINFNGKPELIELLTEDDDNAFIEDSIKAGKIAGDVDRSRLKIVFTSLHGTSITLIPETLKRAGYSDLHVVKEQAFPDGEFPTVKSPNPEEPEALKMAVDLANKVNADIVIGTDPDSDRLGVAVRDNDGNMVLLNGNQTMIAMTDFLLKQTDLKSLNDPFIGSTIVSTPMMHDLARSYNVECKEGLTGFKWIAKMIKDHPQQDFVGGGEESFGYMVGDFVRDKDAVTACLLACEMYAFAKENNSTVYKELMKLYVEHGVYQEKLVSLVKKGISGAAEIKQMMVDLRENPPAQIGGQDVTIVEDYAASTRENKQLQKTETIGIPKSNVLIFYLADGSKIAARPSGTEPKIKFYISVKSTLDHVDDYSKVQGQLEEKINGILASFDM
ncbi:phosphoglucomutase [Nonlabens dokdonensis]|jgi:phosphoglucomutase|uniref:Phosphomannomutase/phosphoglucomutase n=2 Tax=Nonlabens dokdonensis TaxID=328515 RepID=L7WE56_NONDD|nr:phospho-sugar mutase [Nonlabens dokdonensis]AGC78374.1 phosphomannomutase/phosphoglucomutase [Nonlabens dokdonensis DSW-6]PZX38126.1 phosphoglucomutase [Nonlabens dokdonensis]